MLAPAVTPRSSRARSEALHRAVLGRSELFDVLNSLPNLALVVDRNRQAVFANRVMLEAFGLNEVGEVLGRRPGELLECLQADHSPGGCGAAEGCRHCRTAAIVDECLERGARVAGEARVSAQVGGRLTAYDLRVTAAPLELAGERLAMVYLEDISAAKRREHLESIFLHDLLNSISSLQMLAEMPPAGNPLLGRQIAQLADEIRAHCLLTRAEQGDLELDINCVPAAELIVEVVTGLTPLATKRDVALHPAVPVEPLYIASDPQIARRVVFNAAKNAVEAAQPGELVRIGAGSDGPEVVISVWNAQVLNDSTRHQLFQRSFSTKGPGRGLGTYGMRLLLENYLGGKVRFSSAEDQGTTFYLHFPSLQAYLARCG